MSLLIKTAGDCDCGKPLSFWDFKTEYIACTNCGKLYERKEKRFIRTFNRELLQLIEFKHGEFVHINDTEYEIIGTLLLESENRRSQWFKIRNSDSQLKYIHYWHGEFSLYTKFFIEIAPSELANVAINDSVKIDRQKMTLFQIDKVVDAVGFGEILPLFDTYEKPFILNLSHSDKTEYCIWIMNKKEIEIFDVQTLQRVENKNSFIIQ
jgi:hypothetical protein